MLSAEDNEILTRVGPGTQMGNLLRRYWIPACLSAEIAEPDAPASQAIRQAARGIIAATPQELPVLQATPSPAEAPPALAGVLRDPALLAAIARQEHDDAIRLTELVSP